MHIRGFTAPESLEKTSLNEDVHLRFSPHDSENPKNYSLARKYWITTIFFTLVANATFSSSAPIASLDGISGDLHVSKEAAGLVTTLFLLGYVAGPLVWAPLVSSSHSGPFFASEYLQVYSPNYTVAGGYFTYISCCTLRLASSVPSLLTSRVSWSAVSQQAQRRVQL
jgi:MFS family permease